MPKQKKANAASVVYGLAKPIADKLNLMIWDVVFEKEGSYWYLRVYIDKENGGVSMEDCENMTRPLNKALDEADPIEQSYTLEVGSAGIERTLKREEHFKRFLNEKVRVKYIRETDGVKELTGTLKEYKLKENVTLETDSGVEIIVKFSDIAYVKTIFSEED